MDENQRRAIDQLAAVEYAHGSLVEKLRLFQELRATGTAYIEVLTTYGISQHVFAFRDGMVVYAGWTLPTPHEYIAELTQHTYIGMLDTVLAFAARRSSIQSTIDAMVEIGVLQWPQVTRAARKCASLVLEELIPTAGRICFKDGPSGFDLAYGEGEATGFAIDALLLEIELRNQEQENDVPAKAPASRARPVILSVDDSPVAQASIERTLGQTYEVIFCDCALDALNALSSRDDIAMLLLDLMLPGINGLEFCRMLRKGDRYKELPIILLTARGGIVERVRGRFVGISHYLTKPIKPADLLKAVALYVA